MGAISVFLVVAVGAIECPPPGFHTVENFDLESFISKDWYIQQQAPVKYLPVEQNYCVEADYKRTKTFWGWDVQVHNHAEEKDGKAHDSGSFLCAKIVDESAGKLEVGPCFFPPKLTAGPYWIIAYDEQEGYALISGGAPTVATDTGCTTGTGVNGSGLWIFTRQSQRDQVLVDKVRAVATVAGFDISVLNDVEHSSECKYKGAEELVI
jgi:lipocalin